MNIERVYAGRGSEAYHPAMLLGLLIYGYATGTFSSRKKKGGQICSLIIFALLILMNRFDPFSRKSNLAHF